MSKVSLKGVCDMHVHSNPDLRLRAYCPVKSKTVSKTER